MRHFGATTTDVEALARVRNGEEVDERRVLMTHEDDAPQAMSDLGALVCINAEERVVGGVRFVPGTGPRIDADASFKLKEPLKNSS